MDKPALGRSKGFACISELVSDVPDALGMPVPNEPIGSPHGKVVSDPTSASKPEKSPYRQVEMPTRKRGLQKRSSKCIAVDIQKNAVPDYLGSDWTCKRGYRHVLNSCVAVQVPPHANLDYLGGYWTIIHAIDKQEISGCQIKPCHQEHILALQVIRAQL